MTSLIFDEPTGKTKWKLPFLLSRMPNATQSLRFERWIKRQNYPILERLETEGSAFARFKQRTHGYAKSSPQKKSFFKIEKNKKIMKKTP